MQIVFYISGHGFGHASRDIELINTIALGRSDARFVVRTAVRPMLFEAAIPPLDLQQCEADTGVVQIDSLRLDEELTARRAAEFYRAFERRVEEEAAVLRNLAADIVLGDIPPIAFAAAAKAGLPSVAIGNFTWDWIYGAYPAFDTIAPHVIPTIQRAYARATRALRLPLHGGFEPLAAVTRDIPFIARRSTRDPEETKRRLGVPGGSRLVLVSFGAYGADLPLDEIRRSSPFTIVQFDRPPHDLKYADIVAAADVVVSKPGYGIVSECIANHTALLYTSRGRFIEYDLFVAEMPRVLRCRYISQEDLFAGRWAECIDALLQQPEPPERARVDGADVAATEILNQIS
jgi:L-arabinokinase